MNTIALLKSANDLFSDLCGSAGAGAIMPTVELNALTMKLGETAVYTLEGPPGALEAPPPRGGSSYPAPYRPCPPSLQLQAYNRNSRYYNQNNRFMNNYKYSNNTFKDVSLLLYYFNLIFML